MPTTGNVFPTVGENVDRGGLTDWVSPGNITADDAADATVVGGASGSDYLVARAFGFTIPSTALIAGVTVRVEASEHTAGTESLTAQLQNDAATLIGTTRANTISGTGKAVYTYGSATDLWAVTEPSLSPTIVNDADFGVRLWFVTTHDIRIDYVTMAIEYVVINPATVQIRLVRKTRTARQQVHGL